MATSIDIELMDRAIANAARVRHVTSPNPWVGAVLATTDGSIFDGATHPPGGPHAERIALDRAGAASAGATLYTTLEPCGHHGRTPPCTDAIISAGVRRVVVGVEDPDADVCGDGVNSLRNAGVEVDVGVGAAKVQKQLLPYVHHRRTGRPFVVLKLAISLDGRIAAPDGSSKWITGFEARRYAHQLRAESDAVLVGAATVRLDDPELTVRDWSPADDVLAEGLDPRRLVLGTAPVGARVRPCEEVSGSLAKVLDDLGSDGVLQLLVEGGAGVAGQFHGAGLVDRYELLVAPILFGGNDATPMFEGSGAERIADVWRGRIEAVEMLGLDIHVSLVPDET